MIQILTMVSTCSDPALSALLKAIKNGLSIIGILGPILLIASASYHIVQLMHNPEDKKRIANLRNSFIAAAVIFIIPVFVNAAMKLFEDSFTVSACWNNIGDYNGPNHHISLSSQTPVSIYSDPSTYEKGKPKENSDDEGIGSTINGTAQKAGDVVWDPNNVTKKSNLTSTQLIGILNAYGGNAKNFVPYASGLVTAENKYSVNVFFLIGLEAYESGWVTSYISKHCNNLGGVCASSAHPSNGCGKNSNCSFAYFKSVNNFIDYHAKFLHSSYLTPGKGFYEGKSVSAVYTKHYCPGCSSSSITSIANGLFKKVSKVL